MLKLKIALRLFSSSSNYSNKIFVIELRYLRYVVGFYNCLKTENVS